MSTKEPSGKEGSAQQKKRESARPTKETDFLGPEELAVEAWQRATSRPELVEAADVLALQKTVGNESVQRLLNRPADGLQRTPTAPTPSGLASTPGSQTSALPTAVQTAYQARITANDMMGALNVVVQHMTSAGEIDRDLLQTQAEPGSRRSICQGADCFRVTTSAGAFTHDCAEIVSGSTKLPNPRIEISENIIRNPIRLHTTLLHEYRHVRQQFALINQSGSGPTGAGHCLDCNSPPEMDAYLAEVEHGYDPLTMVQAFARAYIIWGYLAPEQKAVFRARKTAAEAKIARHYPGMAWDANGEVIAYRRQSEGLIAAHEGRIGRSWPFYCNSQMAPLNAGTPREGAAVSGSGSGTPAPSSGPSGAGSGTPTVTPEPSGAVSGTPTITPEPSGAGSGTPTVTPEPSGAGSGTPTVTPEPSGAGSGTPTVTPEPATPAVDEETAGS